MLPPDFKPGYFKNFKNALHNELQAAGFLDRFNVLGQMLVSAKNGFGVEDLISVSRLILDVKLRISAYLHKLDECQRKFAR